MLQIQLPLFPELSNGTTATALIQKGFSPPSLGTRSGTPSEQKQHTAAVPDAQLEQEQRWNIKTPEKSTHCVNCSGVPPEHAKSLAALLRKPFGGFE